MLHFGTHTPTPTHTTLLVVAYKHPAAALPTQRWWCVRWTVCASAVRSCSCGTINTTHSENISLCCALGCGKKSQRKNTVHSAIDGKALTRWSAEGKKEWLKIDLAAPTKINALEISFFKGDERTQSFKVAVDGNTLLTKQSSSGKTLAMQRFPFPADIKANTVTIFGKGNSENDWNSLTEVIVRGTEEVKNIELCNNVEKLEISKVEGSADDGKNKANNVVNGDLNTKWSAGGAGEEEQNIFTTLDKPTSVSEIGLAVFEGDNFTTFFDVLVETEEHGWEEVIRDGESVRGRGIESYDLRLKNVKRVNIVCYGMEDWDSGQQRGTDAFTEFELYGCQEFK